MHAVPKDLRCAVRLLCHRPGSALVALASLASLLVLINPTDDFKL